MRRGGDKVMMRERRGRGGKLGEVMGNARQK